MLVVVSKGLVRYHLPRIISRRKGAALSIHSHPDKASPEVNYITIIACRIVCNIGRWWV